MNQYLIIEKAALGEENTSLGNAQEWGARVRVKEEPTLTHLYLC